MTGNHVPQIATLAGEDRGLLVNLPSASLEDGKGKREGYVACIKSLNRGYELNNVQWVYKPINNRKWKLPQDEFTRLCRLVVANSSQR